MNRSYSKFRIALLTFAFGLASVFMINGSLQIYDEVIVDLPKVKSESHTILFFWLPDNNSELQMMMSIEKKYEPDYGGASNAGGITYEEAYRRLRNKKTKIPNCDEWKHQKK